MIHHQFTENRQIEHAPADQYIRFGSGCDTSLYYEIELETPSTIRQKESQGKREIHVIQNKSYQEIADICPLFKDFYEKDLHHSYKFLLATNLMYIKGGQKLFFDGLPDHYERWKAHWKYNKAAGYVPQKCSSAECPYESKCQCQSLYQKLSSRIKRVGDEESYTSLDAATEILDEALIDALSQEANGLYLIKAQTSIGKTTAYCKIARYWNGKKPLMIAVPTLNLQRQVEKDLREYGVETYTTPNVQETLRELGLKDLEKEIEELYKIGFGNRVKKTIRKYLEENMEDLDECTRQGLKQYLQMNKKLDGSKCTITTHAMLLALPSDILKKYEIVVDEDILMAVFKETGSIPFQELKMLLESGALPTFVASGIQEMLKKRMDMWDIQTLEA